MSKTNYLFTSESVSEGHPDKVSDRVSDAIVDTFLAADPLSRVAVETLCTTNRLVLAGEVRGPDSVTHKIMEEVAREAVKDIGYEQAGFHWAEWMLRFMYTLNPLILLKVLMRQVTKTKVRAIRVLCSGMHAGKQMY